MVWKPNQKPNKTESINHEKCGLNHTQWTYQKQNSQTITGELLFNQINPILSI